MTDTPTSRIVAQAEARATRETTDARGRKIKFRMLGALDRFNLFQAIGAQDAANAPLFGMSVIAACCTEIDGVPAPFPANLAQIKAAIARLDDDGINAIGAAFSDDPDGGA